jgi:hypothetical protein
VLRTAATGLLHLSGHETQQDAAGAGTASYAGEGPQGPLGGACAPRPTAAALAQNGKGVVHLSPGQIQLGSMSCAVFWAPVRTAAAPGRVIQGWIAAVRVGGPPNHGRESSQGSLGGAGAPGPAAAALAHTESLWYSASLLGPAWAALFVLRTSLVST